MAETEKFGLFFMESHFAQNRISCIFFYLIALALLLAHYETFGLPHLLNNFVKKYQQLGTFQEKILEAVE